MRTLVAFALAAVTGTLLASDPHCPRYPSAIRTEQQESLELDRDFQEYARRAKPRLAAAMATGRFAVSDNFVDQILFQKMTADGVTPAPRSSDSEFLRRICLVLD